MNRNEQERLGELIGSSLYRRLMPRKWVEIFIMAVFTLLAAVLTVGVGGQSYVVLFLLGFEEDGMKPQLVIGLAVLGLLLFYEIVECELKLLRKAKQLNAQKSQRLAGLDAQMLFALQEEISMAALRYGTFYLLEDYLYAPKARLLLRYTDIISWKTIRKQSAVYGTRCYAEIRERGGYVQKLRVRQHVEYQMDSGKLLSLLRERRRNDERNTQNMRKRV